MWGINWSRSKAQFRKKSLAEVKDLARVLVIDDRRPQLVDDLVREGWRVKYSPDLDSYQATDLVDAHVVCLDIIGVGVGLRCDSGLELVSLVGRWLRSLLSIHGRKRNGTKASARNAFGGIHKKLPFDFK